MGLIDATWPLSPREPDSPAWESLSDEAKDRFDHLVAVYAAMVEAIDTSVGVLVKGLEARGALDNTLILFLRNNVAARHPDIVKSLATQWNTWAERAHVDPWPGPRRLPWGDDAPAAGRGGK